MNQQEKDLHLTRTREQLDHFAWLLDNCFKVPGTNWRFGLEALIGLIPGAGDVVSGSLGLLLLVRALQFRLPGVVVGRMVLNSLLDLTIGAIPFIGDAFDFVYKANTRNMKLFHEYAQEPLKSTSKHWLFIAALICLFLGVAFVSLSLVVLAFWRLLGLGSG